MNKPVVLACAAALQAAPAQAIDLAALWNFSDPAGTEQRLRSALDQARGDDALILQTQIARTHGLRRDFAQARTLLQAIEPATHTAGAEARVRHALEWGRAHASAAHDPATLSDADRATARQAFQRAIDLARDSGLDSLAIDAIHMMAFVDPAPADQRRWAEQALAVSLASAQPAAQRWQPAIRNNLGMALHGLGRRDEALAQFEQALALREAGSDAGATRVARWMVAWTLRTLGRADEALALQLRLARECEAAGQPDPYVFEELATLYRERGDEAQAQDYQRRRQALAD